MARIRTIKPEFFRHEGLQSLGPIPMLVFAGLWTQCDKAGNFPWKPSQLKLDILPFIDYDIGSTLEALRKSGEVIRYFGDDGKEYGHIPTFVSHQRFFGSEVTASPRFPAYSLQKSPLEVPMVHQGSSKEVSRIVELGVRSCGVKELGEKENPPESFGDAQARTDGLSKNPKKKKTFQTESLAYKASRFFADEYLKSWAPTAIITESDVQRWAISADAIFRIDGRTKDDFNDLLDWIDTQKPNGPSGFLWRNNIRSLDTLRTRWREGKFVGWLAPSLRKDEYR